MAKTKNRKRAKLLHLRKRERDALQMAKSRSEKILENRLIKRDYIESLKLEQNMAPFKISELVLKLIQPLMDQATSFHEQQNVVGLGIMAWNLGTIKTCRGEDIMLESLDIAVNDIPDELKNELLKYIDIKCEKYSAYNHIIHDFEFQSVDKKNNHLTVAYETMDKN
jgi:hypothetical protein